jgi:serine/threonine protein kinase
MLGEEQVLHHRYHIQRQLGHNAGRRTLLAQDLHSQELVVLKILSFNSDFRWEDLKLFEREAETLKSHRIQRFPAISISLSWTYPIVGDLCLCKLTLMQRPCKAGLSEGGHLAKMKSNKSPKHY